MAAREQSSHCIAGKCLLSLWFGNILLLFSIKPAVSLNGMMQYNRAHICTVLYIHALEYIIGHALSAARKSCVSYTRTERAV